MIENQKAVILHNKISANPTKDELDVLDQVKVINEALNKLGYSVETVPFSFEIIETMEKLKKINPQFVFNLFEGLENDGQLICLATTILDHLKIPYTGCTKEAMFLTSNKVLTKKFMVANEIPTLPWVTIDDEDDNTYIEGERYLLKAIWEDGSLHLENDSVVSPKSKEELINLIKQQNKKYKKEFFAEKYGHGRDIGTSILAGKVLPSREIIFVNYPEDKVRITGYKAKWEEETEEYQNTESSFEFADTDKDLIKKLEEITLKCWNKFNLNGYATVDYNVDKDGNPYVLEINPNPCIADDSLFYYSVKIAKIPFELAVQQIIEDIRYIY